MTRSTGKSEAGYSYGVAGRVNLEQLKWAVAYAIPNRAPRSFEDTMALARSVYQASGNDLNGKFIGGTSLKALYVESAGVTKHFVECGRSSSEIDRLNWLLELAVARNERNSNGKGSIDGLVKP